MLSIIAGFIAGFALGALAFVLLKGGVAGLVVGAAAAALGYVGVSALTERQRRIGNIAVDLVPDGDKALAVIDQANACVERITGLMNRIHDMRVRSEANDVVAATNALIRYVTGEPKAYPTLSHFINVYGDQTASLLQGYLDVERAGVLSQLGRARTETIEALQALETTAAGELRHAVEAKTLSLTADSDAIVRLARMDGYDESLRLQDEPPAVAASDSAASDSAASAAALPATSAPEPTTSATAAPVAASAVTASTISAGETDPTETRPTETRPTGKAV
ncbi:5-bromo-4-chloroindolyl phosphate hydrolysis family protein [Bifidobacterium leontopitheci]|uniref:5-bromo-4-chloroindolyl phosphate hydrolysis protein n=1 Tax=Bifidobacterium leontopitheci TaxID=2650774 RepID=A0A6I1GE27_9BIFI|nr:5-bromo-4-chloroindolyl phosphate hydrolysis family protein [Bifidobacterium leontopitheci]KAB7789880.1 5-bromo-4-chloroindolyl phosphate hydrolysis protein [Bifidobacterium leontopitheci]